MRNTLSLIALALAAFACGQQPGSAAPDAAGADAATGVDAGSPSGADTGVGPDASAPAPFAGDCSPALPSIATQPWRHTTASELTTAQGSANHRTRDPIASPGEPVSVRGRFTYGIFDKDLEDEDVEVWLRRCPDWVKLGVFTTDGEGVVFVPMPADLPKGEYRLHFQVLGDATSAEGVFAVWPSGTKAVVTDIDGTLTTDDWQAVQDVIGLGELSRIRRGLDRGRLVSEALDQGVTKAQTATSAWPSSAHRHVALAVAVHDHVNVKAHVQAPTRRFEAERAARSFAEIEATGSP